MPAPQTRYARSGDVNVAYQVLGEGPLDLVRLWHDSRRPRHPRAQGSAGPLAALLGRIRPTREDRHGRDTTLLRRRARRRAWSSHVGVSSRASRSVVGTANLRGDRGSTRVGVAPRASPDAHLGLGRQTDAHAALVIGEPARDRVARVLLATQRSGGISQAQRKSAEKHAGSSASQCAREDSNLHGSCLPQGPQPCASTNSATGA